MLKKIRHFFEQIKRVRETERKHSHIVHLMESFDLNWALSEKIDWLRQILRWIRNDHIYEFGSPEELSEFYLQRLRFFLDLIKNEQGFKINLSITLNEILSSISAMELFCETGLTREVSWFGEFKNRLIEKLLPEPPLEEDLSYLVAHLFPHHSSALWISRLNEPTACELLELFKLHESAQDTQAHLQNNMEEALLYLAFQVRSLGLSREIRRRLDQPEIRNSSFFHLVMTIEDFIEQRKNSEKAESLQVAINAQLNSCMAELESVHRHLNEYGVSVQIVFQVQVIKEYLSRIHLLVTLLATQNPPAQTIMSLLAQLIKNVHQMQSLRELWQQNVSLLALKIVERVASTGEHYITRDRAEYLSMLRAAAGGGAIMAIALYVKTFIAAMGMSAFMTGFAVSLNYAISFLVIHFMGFTLGTKQSAMTAPALATKLETYEQDRVDVESVVTDIVCLIRSQVASVLGNVLLVVPVSLVIDGIAFVLFQQHLLPAEKAAKVLGDNSLFSLAPFYAAFTGVLLWLTSIISGWFDNWFAFHGLRRRIMKNPTFTKAFGKVGARKIALGVQTNISGFAGNIFLGLALGLLPEIMKFLGLPLDIRHVTVSAGMVAASAPALGVVSLSSWSFARALLGTVAIGTFNVGVSFALAFRVAMQAKELSPLKRKLLYQAIRRRFFRKPFSFVLPQAE